MRTLIFSTRTLTALSMGILAVAVALTGCSGGSGDSQQASSGSTKTPAQQISARIGSTAKRARPANAKFELTGVWLGTSGLDTGAFEAKLATLDEKSAAQLRTTAATFDSMFIAAQYNPDGRMELDMTIQPDGGEALRDQAFGTWEAKKISDSVLEVTTVEQRGDQIENSVKRYSIVDANHFSITPDISADLKEFSPVILFERVLDEQIPMSAEANSDATVR